MSRNYWVFCGLSNVPRKIICGIISVSRKSKLKSGFARLISRQSYHLLYFEAFFCVRMVGLIFSIQNLPQSVMKTVTDFILFCFHMAKYFCELSHCQCRLDCQTLLSIIYMQHVMPKRISTNIYYSFFCYRLSLFHVSSIRYPVITASILKALL